MVRAAAWKCSFEGEPLRTGGRLAVPSRTHVVSLTEGPCHDTPPHRGARWGWRLGLEKAGAHPGHHGRAWRRWLRAQVPSPAWTSRRPAGSSPGWCSAPQLASLPGTRPEGRPGERASFEHWTVREGFCRLCPGRPRPFHPAAGSEQKSPGSACPQPGPNLIFLGQRLGYEGDRKSRPVPTCPWL